MEFRREAVAGPAASESRRFARLLPPQPLCRPVWPGHLATASQIDSQLRHAVGPPAAVARKIQPASNPGPGPLIRRLSRSTGRTRLPRRSRNPQHARPRPLHQLRTAPRPGVFPRFEDQRSSLLRDLLYRLRRAIRRHHERQPALRLRLRQPRAAALRHALHHRRQRTKRRTTISGADPCLRRHRRASQLLARLVSVPPHHRRPLVLPPEQ
jgi:hypothetical protein